jgi:hypothetical protein
MSYDLIDDAIWERPAEPLTTVNTADTLDRGLLNYYDRAA